MANDMMVKELEQVVVRFSGDSGDGMQLAGNIFSTVSATVGNDILFDAHFFNGVVRLESGLFQV